MKKLVEQVCAALGQGEDIVLVTVSGQSGSTPRQAGAKMLVDRDGRAMGTIGGGPIEARAMEEAMVCLASGQSLCRTYELSNQGSAATDMICGGKMELFLDFIRADEGNLAVFASLLAVMNSGRKAALACRIDPHGHPQRFAIDCAGEMSHPETPRGLLLAIQQNRSPTPAPMFLEHQGSKYLISFLEASGTLYLVGAGHVAACTAQAAARVGFRVVVIDDRDEFANPERFPLADEIKVSPTFADCFQDCQIDEDSYLVIVTRGHLYDMEVLRQALRTRAGYIGMIGSHKKRDAIYAKLMEQGVRQAALQRVHCPIGLAIQAETPEEIAVSIVGELIQQRAFRRRACPPA